MTKSKQEWGNCCKDNELQQEKSKVMQSSNEVTDKIQL